MTKAVDLDVSLLGVNQTWQSVTRTSGVQYTNSTSRPIQLIRYINSTAGGIGSTIVMNGVTIQLCSAYSGVTSVSCCGSIIIPPGATYTITDSGSPTVSTWELR
jgi:hypothetical protein